MTETSYLKCPNCGAAPPEGAKDCQYCGSALPKEPPPHLNIEIIVKHQEPTKVPLIAEPPKSKDTGKAFTAFIYYSIAVLLLRYSILYSLENNHVSIFLLTGWFISLFGWLFVLKVIPRAEKRQWLIAFIAVCFFILFAIFI